MECPYCGRQMEKGKIEADNTLQWLPEGERRKGGTRWATNIHAIKLASFYFIFPAAVTSYCCKNCKKIIIDIPEKTKKSRAGFSIIILIMHILI